MSQPHGVTILGYHFSEDTRQAAIELLNFFGIPYPDIDPKQVYDAAAAVRKFAEDFNRVHGDADKLVAGMDAQGMWYRALTGWVKRTNADSQEIHVACEIVAVALDAAAVMIKVTQDACLVALAGLGAAFIGSLAAALATGGLAGAMTFAIGTAAKKIVTAMEQALVGYLIGEVLEKAIQPLAALVDRVISEYGRPTEDMEPGQAQVFEMNLDQVAAAANQFDLFANQIAEAGDTFANTLAGLTFTTGDTELVGPNPYEAIFNSLGLEPPAPGTFAIDDMDDIFDPSMFDSSYPALPSGDIGGGGYTPRTERPAMDPFGGMETPMLPGVGAGGGPGGGPPAGPFDNADFFKDLSEIPDQPVSPDHPAHNPFATPTSASAFDTPGGVFDAPPETTPEHAAEFQSADNPDAAAVDPNQQPYFPGMPSMRPPAKKADKDKDKKATPPWQRRRQEQKKRRGRKAAEPAASPWGGKPDDAETRQEVTAQDSTPAPTLGAAVPPWTTPPSGGAGAPGLLGAAGGTRRDANEPVVGKKGNAGGDDAGKEPGGTEQAEDAAAALREAHSLDDAEFAEYRSAQVEFAEAAAAANEAAEDASAEEEFDDDELIDEDEDGDAENISETEDAEAEFAEDSLAAAELAEEGWQEAEFAADTPRDEEGGPVVGKRGATPTRPRPKPAATVTAVEPPTATGKPPAATRPRGGQPNQRKNPTAPAKSASSGNNSPWQRGGNDDAADPPSGGANPPHGEATGPPTMPWR